MNLFQECANSACERKPGPGGKSFKQCSGCKVLCYCSTICQKEHWRKVHKQHCKNLHPANSVENGVEVNKLIIDGVNMNSPFGRSENFLDNILKDLYSTLPSQGLVRKYSDTRYKYWLHVLRYGDSWNSINCFLKISQLSIKRYNDHLQYPVEDIDDHLLLTCQMLLVLTSFKDVSSFSTEMFGELGEGTRVVLNKIRKKAFLFYSSCISFQPTASCTEKLKILLVEGNSLETCFVCKMVVTPTMLVMSRTEEYVSNAAPRVVACAPYYRILGLQGVISCCGKQVCNGSICEIMKRHQRELSTARFVYDGWWMVVFYCDYCGGRSRVHRCSNCKSRWYCGAECQLEDWRLVHKDVCVKLKKGKKQRFNSDERKEAALKKAG